MRGSSPEEAVDGEQGFRAFPAHSGHFPTLATRARTRSYPNIKANINVLLGGIYRALQWAP